MGGYDLELVVDSSTNQPIKINSTTNDSINNQTILKINDGGTVNTAKDLHNLNRMGNKLGSTVDVQSSIALSAHLDATSTSLTVTDGSKFADSGTIIVREADGANLQTESITYTGKSGNTLTGLTRSTSTTQLNGAIDNAATTITVNVDSGSIFSAGETILVDTEHMTINSISSNALTVSRAANNTTIAAHSNDATVHPV